MRIDVHAHYWTDAYLDMLVDMGLSDTATQRGIGAGGGTELDARLRLMDRGSVDVQVLSAAPQLPYAADEERAVSAARHVNDEYSRLVATHPDRFHAFAATPMPYIDASIGEARSFTCTRRATPRARRWSASITSPGWWAHRSRTPSPPCS
jgi:aminocarboxymuconate-semialdehyde decarboxylase